MKYSIGVYSVPISGLLAQADDADQSEAVAKLGAVEEELAAAAEEGWKFAGLSTATEKGTLFITVILTRGGDSPDPDSPNPLHELFTTGKEDDTRKSAAQ